MMHFHECLFVLDVKASGSYESDVFIFLHYIIAKCPYSYYQMTNRGGIKNQRGNFISSC